jgi:hypothetical protein
MAFEYYAGQSARSLARAPRSVLPVIRWGVVKPYVEDYVTLSPAQISAVAGSCRRLWLITSHEGQLHGPSARSRSNWFGFIALRAALERAYREHDRVQFGYAATIHVDLLSLPAGAKGAT